MTVFKTFLKVLNKNKFIVILYTVILITFGGFNLETNENSMGFVSSKPDIYIVNEDENEGITQNLIAYLTENSNVVEIENKEDKINDALFYRDVNYIVYIPKNFRNDFLSKKNPTIEIKSTGDYQASLAEMLLSRYLNVAKTYIEFMNDEEKIIENINKTLGNKIDIEVSSSLDVDSLTKATTYFNFASYSLLAGCVYVICLILSSFKEEKIAKRTIISSINYRKFNRELLLSNGLFAILLWIFYILLSILLLGKIMFTTQGFIYMGNALLFTLCALTFAFFLGNLIHNKNAINGIVNVVALGSSFLCGAFVPMEWLPSFVLKIAHLLPSYYYISSNELLTSIEVFDYKNVVPILVNMGMLVLFILLFIVLTNVVSKKKRRIA